MTEIETITEQHLIAAYRSCFTAPGCDLVLRDLAKWCRAAESCVEPGDRDQTLVNEGRREAFLRIQKFMNLGAPELATMFVGRITRSVK